MTLWHRLKVGVAKTACHPAIGEAVAWVLGDRIWHRGCIIATDNPAVTPKIKAMVFWHLYESKEIRFIERYLPTGVDVVELGASIGVVSAFLAQRMSPGSRLLCVEADPVLARIARRNAAWNAQGVEVEVVAAAISYDVPVGATVRLERAKHNIDGRLSKGGGAPCENAVEVQATRLSALLAERRIERYALVCDIEGVEADIFEADAPALRCAVSMVIELHEIVRAGVRLSIGDVLQRALKAGFAVRAKYGPVCYLERVEAS